MADLLEVRGLERWFHQRGDADARIRAVDGVSFAIRQGESLGLVGESGSGKSTVARLILRLIEPSAGTLTFEGKDITHADSRALLPIRRRMQAVFQDPYASLNGTFSVRRILEEPYRVHRIQPAGGLRACVSALLDTVGLEAGMLDRRPLQLSGGQLQRVAIARALALDPDFIVADEATSALDVSVQAQIVNLLIEIQRQRNVSYLFISHDLDLVGHLSDRIAVMYLGAIVELAHSAEVMRRPLHPYTQALISAVPVPDPDRQRARRRVLLPGDPPNAADVPTGCRFHPRCPIAQPVCATEVPPLRPVNGGQHLVACHFAPDQTEAAGRSIGQVRAAGRPLPEASTPTAASAREEISVE